MANKYWRHAAGVFIVFSGTGLLLRASQPGAGAAMPKASPQVVTYDAGAARWLNAPHTVEMSRGVTFNQDDSHLKTDAAVVALDDQQRALNAKSQTNVHLYDTQNDLTGGQGFIDFTRHIATLKDNIVLVVKPDPATPKGSIRSQFKDAATLTCALMTYDYRTKIGRVPGTLTIRQKDRVLTADSGEYNTRAQTAALTGNVHGHNGNGEIRAPHVILGLQQGNEYLAIDAPTTGVFGVPPEQGDAAAPPSRAKGKKPAPAPDASATTAKTAPAPDASATTAKTAPAPDASATTAKTAVSAPPPAVSPPAPNHP